MDKIAKAILFGGKAIVSALDTTDITNYAIEKHKINDGVATVLSRALTICSFMSAGFKGLTNNVSIEIDGGGKLGKIIVAGETGGNVRGYIQNKNETLKMNDNGKFNIEEAVGSNGYLQVRKVFNVGKPYSSKLQLVSGNIVNDFAYYFTKSEQLPTAIAIASKVKNGVCVAAGAIIIQPMPNCDDNIITVLEDIVRNFVDLESLMKEKSLEQIIDDNFGHFEISHLENLYPIYKCTCSDEKIINLITGLGLKEANSIVEENGKIEVHCDFCNKFYAYGKNEIKEIFANGRIKI